MKQTVETTSRISVEITKQELADRLGIPQLKDTESIRVRPWGETDGNKITFFIRDQRVITKTDV
jgi:hypothetical protein